MLELSEELNDRDHRITVITSWPKYNLEKPLEHFDFKEKQIQNGIQIIRVKTLPHHNVNFFLRGISQLIMPFQFVLKIIKYRVKPDAVVVYSPPLPLAFVGTYIKLKNTRFILNVQDLFPKNAIDLGILRNPILIQFFRILEKFAYKSADIITLHSEGNKRELELRNPKYIDKMRILHNWVHFKQNKKNNLNIDFKKKWDLKQKYIAIFAGVMGPSQNLELLLEIAKHMQSETELLFLFVGDGQEKKALEKKVLEQSLVNVRFEGFISSNNYYSLLSICSIGLVCLSPLNKTPVVPGKILGYMSAGLPIAAFLQNSSDGHNIIREAKCGISVDSADKNSCIQEMQNFFLQKKSFSKIGQNGKSYAIENFSKEKCISELESMIIKK